MVKFMPEIFAKTKILVFFSSFEYKKKTIWDAYFLRHWDKWLDYNIQ